MNNQGRITGQRKKFAQVSNHPLQNPELTLKAKGLYGMIESYINIPNFILYKNTLLKSTKDGKTAFESAWKELKDAGYLIQHRRRNMETNQFYYEYELLEEPVPDFEGTGNPVYGKQGLYSNTDLNNTDLKNTHKPQQDAERLAYAFLAIYKEVNQETHEQFEPEDLMFFWAVIDKALMKYDNVEIKEQMVEYINNHKEEATIRDFAERLQMYM